ncbi:alkane hydroxylase MAH1-like protein [Cinnamomum micranthum f. kanehirae]|uniref:Alkane hydroxylase MAH1-like protein n=1 Tax=Cinnamomum micranthum f. kanehirae TaxID=337451 RepID=A0A443PQ82_9MAGN|nr:alkane hydroxylase MAH1-like protein [Cinnamomum micranthum f. kanehirae]
MLPSALLNVHRIMDWIADILLANGCTVLFEGPWFSGMKILITCDPRNLAHILSNAHFSNYNKGDGFTEIFDILGDGILAADDGSWKVQRKIAHSHFRNKRFRQLVAKTNQDKVEKGLVPVLQTAVEEARPFDLQDIMKRFTFDATSILVCGADPGCLSIGLPTVPFVQALDDGNEVMLLRHTVPKFWRTLLKRLNMGMEKKHSDAWVIIDEYIEKKTSTRREELQSRTPPPNNLEKEEDVADLLTLYMEYEMREEEMANLKSPNTFLRDTTINMLAAGRDTTSAALTWFFWLLSKNPSVEARILQELSSIPNPNPTTNKPRVFTSEKLGGLVYLHAALYESLRLFPPVPLDHKGVVAPDILPSGHQVKPGMIIIYSIYAMGRMETIWGIDCLEFRPERWISEQGVITLDHRDKFFVFNAGSRSCLGKGVSLAQMKAVVAALLCNFELEVLQDQVVSPKTATTLHTKNGLMVKIRERAVAAA